MEKNRKSTGSDPQITQLWETLQSFLSSSDEITESFSLGLGGNIEDCMRFFFKLILHNENFKSWNDLSFLGCDKNSFLIHLRKGNNVTEFEEREKKTGG